MTISGVDPTLTSAKKPRAALKQPKSIAARKKKNLAPEVKTKKEFSEVADGRMKRKTVRPTQYLNLPPPSKNKPHSDKVSTLLHAQYQEKAFIYTNDKIF